MWMHLQLKILSTPSTQWMDEDKLAWDPPLISRGHFTFMKCRVPSIWDVIKRLTRDSNTVEPV